MTDEIRSPEGAGESRTPAPDPSPPAAAAERPDPNYILSQEEFHKSQEAQCRRQLAGEKVILDRIRNEGNSLVATFGWVALSLGFWFCMIGLLALRGQLRGRP